MLSITFNGDRIKPVLKVSGDLDRPGIQKLRLALKEMPKNSSDEKVIDFSGIEFIGTSGLAFFLEWAKACFGRGEKVKVIHAPTHIQSLFASVHLDKILSFQ